MIFFNKANTKTSLRNGSSLFFASTTNRQPTQNETDGNQAPAGSVYSPTLIKVMGWTTRRPFARHQRSSELLRDGTRIPEPPKDSAEAMSACMSRLLSAVAWPKSASPDYS
jgi:hypothetical protein